MDSRRRLGCTLTCLIAASSTPTGCAAAELRDELPRRPREDVTPAARLDVIAVPGGIKDLAVGDAHACALNGEGRVACWGDGRFFQLGDLSTEGRTVPREIADLRGVIAIDAGATSTCAQLASGEVACWGARYNGMVDEVYDEVKAPATVVHGIAWPRAFAVGGRRAAYVGHDGHVAIWEAPVDVPIPIEGFDDALEVAVAYENVCARTRDGAVRCMGPNWGGEAGNGGDGEAVEPVDVVGASELDPALFEKSYETCGSSPARDACDHTLKTAVDLDAWGRLTCAVLASGRVACWGAGKDEHARWLGSLDFARVPILVPKLADAVAVAVGWGHVCALREDGRVACWGHNDKGQLGTAPEPDAGSEASRRPPRDVPGLVDAVQLEAGADFTCARRATGDVACWGELPWGGRTPSTGEVAP